MADQKKWTREQSDRFGHWMLSSWLPWLKRQTDPKHQVWAKTTEAALKRLEEKYPELKRPTR
jgi:hypothetical protein